MSKSRRTFRVSKKEDFRIDRIDNFNILKFQFIVLFFKFFGYYWILIMLFFMNRINENQDKNIKHILNTLKLIIEFIHE